MMSARSISARLTRLSGLLNQGLVRSTFPPGDVMRKNDQVSHSSETAPVFVCAIAANGAASRETSMTAVANRRVVSGILSFIVLTSVDTLVRISERQDPHRAAGPGEKRNAGARGERARVIIDQPHPAGNRPGR